MPKNGVKEDELNFILSKDKKEVKKPVKRIIKKKNEVETNQAKSSEKITRKVLPKKVVIKMEKEDFPEIEYELKSVTKYDLNWYYVKERFIKFKKWILSPYMLYANWWNRSFNSVNIDNLKLFDENEQLYESIKNQKVENKNLSKRLNYNLPKIEENEAELIDAVINEIFAELKPRITESVKKELLLKKKRMVVVKNE